MMQPITAMPTPVAAETERTVTIGHRFCGLPGIVQGGYSSGMLAAELGAAAAEVKLRRPVPAGRELTISRTEDGVELADSGTTLAVGRETDLDIEVPAAPSPGEVAAAARRFPGHRSHPYPDCFACGPERAEGDGLRVFPGPVADGRPLVAAPWSPPAQLGGEAAREAIVWAAFDCAQLWSLIVHEPSRPGERVVTAALTAEMREGDLDHGVEHVLYAWPIGRDGDLLRAGAVLAGPDGGIRAVGVQTAVLAKWGVPLDLGDHR